MLTLNGNMRIRRHSTLVFAVLVIGGTIISAGCQEERRRPTRYLFPDGYVGWIRIEFNFKDAAALPIEDGYYLCRFPLTGDVSTSTPIEYGWGKDEFYYYSGDVRRPLVRTGWGHGGMIWAGYTSARDEEGKAYLYLFVGTEEAYKKYGVNVPRDARHNPQVGPL